jgi:hypothetical protein
MKLLLVFLTAILFGATTAVQARIVESFELGNWDGSAFVDDETGRFSTCVGSANYRSGITMLVQIDSNYNWVIGFSSKSWNLDVGSEIPLQYRIDSGAWQSGVGVADFKDLVRMHMPTDGYIITRFRRGRTLYVNDGTQTFEFRLTGTSRLMARLARCVEKNTARYGAGVSMVPAPSVSAGPAQPGVSADASKEDNTASPDLAFDAMRFLFDVVSGSGISGLKYIADDKRSEGYEDVHAVVGNEARIVAAHILGEGEYESHQEIMSLMVADSAKRCEGTFQSGSQSKTMDGTDVLTGFSRCEAGDFELSERYVITDRSAGGVFIIGIADTFAGESSGIPAPAELSDENFAMAAIGARF